MADAALQRRLLGVNDPRGPQGIMSRGANVYNGGSPSAHSGGGPQFGRPRTNPLDPNLANPGGSILDVMQQAASANQDGAPVNMDPLPVNPMQAAIQRRLQGSQSGFGS